MRRFIALTSLAVLAGCRAPARQACDAADCRGSMTTLRWEQNPARVLDLLFVIDPRAFANDGEQVRSRMKELAIQVIKAPGAFDVHIAVVSSVLDPATGDPINLLAVPGPVPCAPRGAFLTTGAWACGVMPNFEGGLDEALACLGAGADGVNQPLEVARRILEPGRRPAAFADFLRDRVRMVVIISPRDDASPAPAAEPAALAAYLDALAPTYKNGLGLSIIAPGWGLVDGSAGDGRCALAPDQAPADRLLALRQAAADRTVYLDICSDDWFRAIEGAFAHPPYNRPSCLPPGLGARDAGPPVECVARLTTSTPTGPVTAPLPPCTSGQRPCFEFRPKLDCGDSEWEAVVLPNDCVPTVATELELVCAGP